MKKFLFAIFLVAAIMIAVPEAQAQDAANFEACASISDDGLLGLANCIIGFFNAAIYVLMSLAVLFTIYGAFQMVSSEEKRESGRQRIIHGIIGLFVMISIWGFVNILKATFGIGGEDPHDAPTLRSIE
jgi:hypothetical protein